MDIDDLSRAESSGNVAQLHDATVEHHGGNVAIDGDGANLTHAHLREASIRFGGGLRDLGLEPGDVLLLYLPNCPEYLIAALGAFRAGAVVSPVNPMYKRRELAYQLEDAAPRAVLTHRALRDTLDEALADADLEDSPRIVVVDDEAAGTAGGGATDGGREPDDDGTSDADLSPEAAVPFSAVEGESVTVDPDGDVAMLPYTSGTTGQPKGVELTHRNLRAQTCASLALRGDELDDEDVRSLVYLPLYHITGFVHTAWQPLIRGGTVYLRNPMDWDAETAMSVVESEEITHFVGVTAMYVDLIGDESFGEYDLTSLEMAGEGGAKMSQAVQREFEETAGVDMSEGYGLTETTGATHSQSGSSFGLRHGTIGQPLRMTDCKIVDEAGAEVPPGEEGELLVRGPQVMERYHGMPEATAAAFTDGGYFRTGDVARRDADNYYEIVDRKKHVIVSAGYNVYPSELEELLAEHEAVAEAAVVGVPDDRRNEVPKAYVVVKPGVEAGVDVTAADLRGYCLDEVAEYKHPRAVEFIDELPRTASGKIRKFKLEEQETDEGAAGETGA